MIRTTATAVALTCVHQMPPTPTRKTAYIGSDTLCCVCGGIATAQGPAFSKDKVLAETFMRPDDMEWERSEAVCAACTFFCTPNTFHQCIEGRLPDVKLWPQASWRSYSHYFGGDDHRIMKPSDWREIFLNPPQPPFVCVISLAGKKNIMHRAKVAESRDRFPVQLEEDTVWIEPRTMTGFISLAEQALTAGWTRDEITAGECKHSTALKMGLGAWSSLRTAISTALGQSLNGMRLATLSAHRPKQETHNA